MRGGDENGWAEGVRDVRLFKKSLCEEKGGEECSKLKEEGPRG